MAVLPTSRVTTGLAGVAALLATGLMHLLLLSAPRPFGRTRGSPSAR